MMMMAGKELMLIIKPVDKFKFPAAFLSICLILYLSYMSNERLLQFVSNKDTVFVWIVMF